MQLVVSRASQGGRERVIPLSLKGEELLPRLQAVWDGVGAAAAELSSAAGHNLVRVLEDVIASAQEIPFKDRTKAHIDKRETVQGQVE